MDKKVNKKELIKQCFELLTHCTSNMFVVPRGHDEIPDQVTAKNDIDILLVGKYSLKPIAEYFQKNGFKLHIDQHRYMYGAEPHIQFTHDEWDVKLDMVTGLYYRSIVDKMLWMPVNKEVFESMIRNRVYCKNEIWKFRPAFEDELVHIVCHCIFDKRKTPEKYVKRINELLPIIDESKVNYLLEKAFYKASDIVFETMKTNPENLHNAYITFTEY